MKDVYIVTFHPGTSGTFLASLIHSWLTNNDLSSATFPSNAHAHDLEVYADSNHDQFIWHLLNKNTNRMEKVHSSETQALKVVRPKDPSKPFVLRQHELLDFELVEKDYPNYLHFHIYFDLSDLDIIAANMFIKNVIPSFIPEEKYGFWQRFNVGHPDPNNLNTKELGFYIKKLSRQLAKLTDVDLSRGYGNYERPSISFRLECSNDKTINIPFAQLMRQPDQVIETLATALDIPAPSYIKPFYESYIASNKSMLADRCPWLDYYTQNT